MGKLLGLLVAPGIVGNGVGGKDGFIVGVRVGEVDGNAVVTNGDEVGIKDGVPEGTGVGFCVAVGNIDGTAVGMPLGSLVAPRIVGTGDSGAKVGIRVRTSAGEAVEMTVGIEVGSRVGLTVGDSVAIPVGVAVDGPAGVTNGDEVGIKDGVPEGTGVGFCVAVGNIDGTAVDMPLGSLVAPRIVGTGDSGA